MQIAVILEVLLFLFLFFVLGKGLLFSIGVSLVAGVVLMLAMPLLILIFTGIYGAFTLTVEKIKNLFNKNN